MEVLGIGLPELVFILLIAVIVLAPQDVNKIGAGLRKFWTSDTARSMRDLWREVRYLPNRLAREANLDLPKWEAGLKRAAARPPGFGPGFGTEGEAVLLDTPESPLEAASRNRIAPPEADELSSPDV